MIGKVNNHAINSGKFAALPGRLKKIQLMIKQFRFACSTFLFSLIVVSVIHTPGMGQDLPDYDLAGARKPNPELRFKKEKQYKKVHQNSLRLILRSTDENKNLARVEEFLNEFLQRNPHDGETLYMLGILEGHRGEIAKAEALMKSAIEKGLPDDRLVAGPRELIEPLAQTDLIKSLKEKYACQLVHGPLLGNVTGSSAAFWARTATECDFQVVVLDEKGNEVARSEPVRSDSQEDFTAVANVEGLQPNTDYRYRILLDDVPATGGNDNGEFQFHTLAGKGQATSFSIAFGGGSGFVPDNERMWNTIGDQDPDAILLLGDNVYIDDPESLVMQQYTYQRRQSRPEWRKLTARSPVFTIWDDHDFGCDDCWGGPQIEKPFWKRDWVFPTFRQNWANPGYGGGDEQPGCWYDFQIGDVDFIMLDCRYYRTDPKSESPSMLGEVQLAWLKLKLAAATGTFKVVCSSVPWDFRTKGDSTDTWNGYRDEHEEILGFIDSENIPGVVLMSADRHRSDAWKISRPNGYDLYEFNSSRLTNQHVHPTMEKRGAIFSYNALQSFGLVKFDTTLADPSVTYEVVNIDGEKPHTITVKLSELRK